MTRKSMEQKIDYLEKKINQSKEQLKLLKLKKYQDIGKHLCDVWGIDSDSVAFKLIDDFSDSVKKKLDGGSNERAKKPTGKD